MHYVSNSGDGNNWWNGTISPLPTGQLIYKIGVYNDQSGGLPGRVSLPRQRRAGLAEGEYDDHLPDQ